MHDVLKLLTYEDEVPAGRLLPSLVTTETNTSPYQEPSADMSHHYRLAFSCVLPECQTWTSGIDA
jgi:hypothetical protein